MDEVPKRLRETSERCFNCYEAWSKNQKDSAAREALQEAIHEVRKVASRLEIELAVSERNEMAQKPIPIPPHRDSRGRSQEGQDDSGNRREPPGGDFDPGPRPSPRKRRPLPKRSIEGGLKGQS